MRDDGCGFDNTIEERLFDPFFTTRQLSKSTGMGLALVHSIIRKHNGMIYATGNPGLGAEFTIHLPLVHPDPNLTQTPAPADPRSNSVGSAGHGRRIIYIDDNEPLVTLVCRLLGNAGFIAQGFTDPEEALLTIEAAPYDVDMVVTDFNMPVLSGLDVVRATALLRPDLAVVIVSGHVTDELRAQAASLGVYTVLYKETLVRDLGSTIGDLLDSRNYGSSAQNDGK